MLGANPSGPPSLVRKSTASFFYFLEIVFPNLGCRLAEGEICTGYEAAIDDPVAQLLSRYFTVSVPGKARMDHSPGELEGEIDFTQRDFAVEYLLVPERVKKLEGQLAVLICDVGRLGDCLEKVTVLLGKLVEPQAGTEDAVVKDAGGSKPN